MKKIYILTFLMFAMFAASWAQEYKRMIAAGTYTVQEIQAAAEAHFNIVGTGRGVGYKPYKRWESLALITMDDQGMLKSPSFYFNELENYNAIINEQQSSSRTTVGAWEQMGPYSWNQTASWSPGLGRVTSIAIDPNDENHILVGADTGGVWKSLDGGSTWTVLTDNFSTLRVSSLAIDPLNSSNYFWGSTGGNIFSSTDGGATWSGLADIGNGTVNKIIIDASNVAKMYCSAENGGIFKSTNSGANWQMIHPSATHGFDVEFKPGDYNTVYASGNNFFKSTDGGVTFNTPENLPNWTQDYISGSTDWTTTSENENGTVTPLSGDAMAILFIDSPSNPITRLVSPAMDLSGATNPKLNFSFTQVNWFGDIDRFKVMYKTSVNGTWIEIADYQGEYTNWTNVELDLPNVSSTYYIGFQGYNQYGRGTTLDDVSISATNLGTVFEDGFENGSNAFGSGEKMMGVSANDPAVIYVLEANSGAFGGFHKSTDSGETFVQLDHGNNNYLGIDTNAQGDGGQAPRDMDVAVNPNDANDVHIAGINTWRSTNGGQNFNITSQWQPGFAAGLNIGYCHADVDILEFVNGKLYAGTDGGLFVANNPTTVNSAYYTDLSTGMGIRQFYRIGVSQTDPVVVTGGSQDNGTSVMDMNGNWTDWLGADGMEGFVDKNNSNILYGMSQFGNMWKSYNGGATANFVPSPEDKSGNWITPFEQDPIEQDVIYVGYDEVYKSTNGGNSWTSISQNFGGNLSHLKIAPSNNNIMYTGGGQALFKTETGGGTWTQVTGFSGGINSIAIHPTNPQRIAIATTSAQKVYVSTNGGATWTSYLNDLPNFAALALAWGTNENSLYLGMNYGVYYIDDTTENSWQPFSSGLPNVIIRELEINFADEKLYAGTYGRGLWRTDLYNPLSVDEFELSSMQLFPNPTSKEFTLSWNKGDKVAIKIFNAEGKIMSYQKGQSLLNSLQFDVSDYASGLYFVRVVGANGAITKKLIVD